MSNLENLVAEPSVEGLFRLMVVVVEGLGNRIIKILISEWVSTMVMG